MAGAFRLDRAFLFSLAFVLTTRFICGVSAVPSPLAGQRLARLKDPNVIFNSNSGTTVVYSPVTGEEIPQGLASDGGGSGFSTSAVLWIIFSFVVGAPLLFAGFRGQRLTIGAALGIAAVLASWAVIVNTLDNVGISDVALTASVFLLFALGFALGLLRLACIIGILVLGILGGLAIGIRITLLRSGLLISNSDIFFLNWLIIGAWGFLGGILVVWKPRYGILSGCASVGSFLCGLGFDLVIKQQSGMSRGLRFLFDRNRYHALDTLTTGYSPTMTTVIILAVSLGVTPAFAFAQWKAFTRPFCGTEQRDTLIGSIWDPQETFPDEGTRSVPQRSVDIADTPMTEKPLRQSLYDDVKGQHS